MNQGLIEINNRGYDKKKSIPELYLAFSKLENIGWKMNKVCDSESRSGNFSLPIVALDNNKRGPALWIIAGIYGDEPAGPNMIAHNIRYITENLKDIPTLILPLCNPQGYLLNHRYLDESTPESPVVDERMSVGDARHKLPKKDYSSNREDASNPECEHLMNYILKENMNRPPHLVINLHDNPNLSEGYIHTFGLDKQHSRRHQDIYAQAIIRSMEKFVGMQKYGQTIYNEYIVKGIVAPVEDSSIDEFMASEYIYGGRLTSDNAYMVQGIGAKSVLRINTPAKDVELENRILALQNALHIATDIMTPYTTKNTIREDKR